jgi:hypothetical protein
MDKREDMIHCGGGDGDGEKKAMSMLHPLAF